jgi:hypothetical protein
LLEYFFCRSISVSKRSLTISDPPGLGCSWQRWGFRFGHAVRDFHLRIARIAGAGRGRPGKYLASMISLGRVTVLDDRVNV